MPEISPSRYLVTASWQDVPHIDQKTQDELLASTPPYLRAARSKGTPSLGAGAIYPIDEDEFLVDPFAIPAYYTRCYGLDVGWNRTAAAFLARDPGTDVVYLYSEHYRGQAEPSIHAASIKARGDWVPGVIDPASRGRMQDDGAKLIALYREQGLDITEANNSTESGLYMVWERLSTSRLKVFRTCMNFRAEYKLYRRDKDGKIVKKFDHLMDATRYGIVSGLERARNMPVRHDGMSLGSQVSDAMAGY